MTICNHCGEDVGVIYICKACGGKFCRTHKNPEAHNCSSLEPENNEDIESVFQEDNKPENNSINIENKLETKSRNYEISEEKSLYEKWNTFLFESENDDVLINPEVNESVIDTELEEEPKDYSNDLFNLLKDNVTTGVKENPKPSNSPTYTNKRKFLYLSIILSTILLASLAITGSLYFENKDYETVYTNYIELYNSTTTLQSYYNELNDQHSELRDEYTELNGLYSTVKENYADLETDYDAVMNFEKVIKIEEGQIITLEPKGNYSIVYSIPFSGYINLNYNATGDSYVWVGSTALDSYYSRYPQFPETASIINFSLPVLPDIIIYFTNPSESETITLTYNIDFIY